MKKALAMVFIATSIFFGSYYNSGAVTGVCAGHGGINCQAGPAVFGYAQCYDNSTSSALYSQTGECANDAASGCVSPFAGGCINPAQLQELQDKYDRYMKSCRLLNYQQDNIYSNCFFPSLQRQIQVCGQEIDKYQAEQQNYSSCITAYYKIILNNASATLDAQRRQEENTCKMKFGYTWDVAGYRCIGTDLLCEASFGKNSHVFKGVGGSPACLCDEGFIRDSGNTECVKGTSTSIAASPSITQAYKLAVNLGLGSSGNDVIYLQRFLQGKGFLRIPAGTKEGYFGSLTKKALADFQKSVGLPATGYCGIMTRKAINSAK